MPIYEYECKVCGHRLEKLQKISDQPLTDCPACEEPGLRKLVSAVAFRLKGGGWYETDFKDEKSRKNLVKEDEKTAEADSGKEADAKEMKKDNEKASDNTSSTGQTQPKAGTDGKNEATSTPAG